MRSVQRALSTFECFSPERDSLSLQEITTLTGLPKSTVFRLLQVLEAAGYLVRLDHQKYCLSLRFARLAGSVRQTLDIRTLARPEMEALAATTGETVTLNTVAGLERVCIEVVDASSPLRGVATSGEHVVLRAGSATRVLMAHLPPTTLAPALRQACKATGKPRTTMAAELEKVRRRGYAVSHGERVPGLSAISAPVTDGRGQAPYSLSVIGPTARIRAREEQFTRLVVKAAAAISLRCGAVMPPAAA